MGPEGGIATQVSVKLERVEGLKFNVNLSGGRRMELNSAEQMGQAFTPMELFLAALVGCTAMDVQWILDRQRQKVERLEISAKGTRRDEDPRYYEKIELDYTIVGPNIRKDAVERAIRLSQEKYCSIRAMLNKSVKVTTTYSIANDMRMEEQVAYPPAVT